MKRRVSVEIDLDALVSNYRKIAAHVAPLKVICILKANAYGLGVAAYARALAKAGCADFGVAEPYEAMELKAALGSVHGARCTMHNIQILSSILPDEIPEMVKEDIILPVTDYESAELISAAALRFKKQARVQLKLDTGMGRLGLTSLLDMDRVFDVPNLTVDGIFTHCPMAYDPKDPFTAEQIKRFKLILRGLEVRKQLPAKVHMAASDAINNFPETAKAPFTYVRTGINLHGSFDPNGIKALDLESVLTLKTRVAQVRTLPAGTTLGYGRTWCLNKESKIATISAGYADGLPLALTNRGHVFIGGRRCKIVGRISMDYTTVDVSEVENVKAGDEVICLGSVNGDKITPDDWAALKGTHAYDIICSFGNRVERVVKTTDI